MSVNAGRHQEKNWHTHSTSTGKVTMVDAFAIDGAYDEFRVHNRKLLRTIRRRRSQWAALFLTLAIASTMVLAMSSGIWK